MEKQLALFWQPEWIFTMPGKTYLPNPLEVSLIRDACFREDGEALARVLVSLTDPDFGQVARRLVGKATFNATAGKEFIELSGVRCNFVLGTFRRAP